MLNDRTKASFDTCLYVFIYLYILALVWICIYLSLSLYMYIYIYIYIRVYVPLSLYIFIYTICLYIAGVILTGEPALLADRLRRVHDRPAGGGEGAAAVALIEGLKLPYPKTYL